MALREKGWTQEKVAEALNIGRSTVSEVGSNVETDNASHTDQRRKVTPEEEEKISEEARSETQDLALREKGWTQKKVAEAIDVSETTISRRERDEVSNLQMKDAYQIDQRERFGSIQGQLHPGKER
jgi:transcriptional regulator